MEVAAVEEDWRAALEDAAMSPSDIALYPHPELIPADRPTAVYVAPGQLIAGQLAAPLTKDQAQAALDAYGRHQILLHTDAERPVLAAKLRHELEHVRQWEAAPSGPDLFVMYEATLAGLEEFVGPDRRGSGVLYNLVPLERDANAAAGRFMRGRLGPAELERLESGDAGILFRADAPPDSSTAATRLVCAAALAADRVEAWLSSHPDGPRGLIDRMTGDPELWSRLRADGELARRVRLAHEAVPAPEVVAASEPNFASARLELRRRLLDAYDHACVQADTT